MREIIKVGVVGCGYWGPNLIRNLGQSPDCQLKAICDMSEQRLGHMRRLHPEVATTNRFEDLLNDKEIDAVVIATPVRFHYDMAKACLKAGKHAFIEKPMARTVAEGEELVALAERQSLVLMVGHTFLFSPAVHRMKEIIDSGDIGEVQYISARRLNLGLFQKDINVAWDLAPHDISIILHLLGDQPVSVSCQGNSHVTRGIEDVTMMYLNFPKNRCAFIQNSWLDPKKVRQMTVVGSRRMIVYDDTEPMEKLKIYDARVEVPPHYDSFAEFTYSYHYGDAYIPYIKQDEPLKLECQHFLECIRDGRVPITSGRHGLEVVRILEASGISLKQHGARVFLGGPAPSRNGDHRMKGDGHGANGQRNGNGHGNGNGNGHENGNGNGHGNGNGNGHENGNGNGNAEIIPTAGQNFVKSPRDQTVLDVTKSLPGVGPQSTDPLPTEPRIALG